MGAKTWTSSEGENLQGVGQLCTGSCILACQTTGGSSGLAPPPGATQGPFAGREASEAAFVFYKTQGRAAADCPYELRVCETFSLEKGILAARSESLFLLLGLGSGPREPWCPTTYPVVEALSCVPTIAEGPQSPCSSGRQWDQRPPSLRARSSRGPGRAPQALALRGHPGRRGEQDQGERSLWGLMRPCPEQPQPLSPTVLAPRPRGAGSSAGQPVTLRESRGSGGGPTSFFSSFSLV